MNNLHVDMLGRNTHTFFFRKDLTILSKLNTTFTLKQLFCLLVYNWKKSPPLLTEENPLINNDMEPGLSSALLFFVKINYVLICFNIKNVNFYTVDAAKQCRERTWI